MYLSEIVPEHHVSMKIRIDSQFASMEMITKFKFVFKEMKNHFMFVYRKIAIQKMTTKISSLLLNYD